MSKVISDPLYGYIEVDSLAMSIVDKPEFCRLRDLKQLAFVYYIFPSAVHNRFVHSIQTYHLAVRWCEKLKLDERWRMPIRIAALIHDIGHVVGCHSFDKLYKSTNASHEQRGERLFRYMCRKYSLEISPENIDLICAIVKGEPDDRYPPYIFQIVANHYNEFDVDKVYLKMDAYMIGFDHGLQEDRIMSKSRIIDGDICFDEKVYLLIYDFYHRRWREFREVLKHHACVSVEVVLVEILQNLDAIYDFKTLLEDEDCSWTCLTDSLIGSCYAQNILHKRKNPLYLRVAELCDILATRNWRKLYPYVDEKNDINVTVGLSGANFHPMDKIWFYKSDNPTIKYHIHAGNESMAVSSRYRELISWRYKHGDVA